MKSKLLFLVFLLCNYSIYAQFDVTWAKNIGGTNTDIGYALELDSQKNVYVAGVFKDDISFDQNSSDFDFTADDKGDVFLVKYDSDGSFVWAKVFSNYNVVVGIDGSHNPVILVIDNNDNIYLASTFKGEIDLDLGQSTDIHVNTDFGYNTFIVKLDNEGNHVWGRSFKSSNPSVPLNRSIELSNIKIDNSNNLLLTGKFHGTVDFNFDSNTSFNMTHSFGQDGFILKINDNGEFIWAKQFTGGVRFYIDTITFDSLNNIIVAGGFSGPISVQTDFDSGIDAYYLNTSGSNDQDIFILKLSSEGNFEWVKTALGPEGSIGTNSYERIKSIVTDNNNNIIFSGHFIETINFDSNSNNFILNDDYCLGNDCDYKAFVGKINANGDMIWIKKINGDHSVVTSGNANAASIHNVLSKNDQGLIYYGLTFNGNLEYIIDGITYNYDDSNVIGWTTFDLVFLQIDGANGDWVNAHVIINNSVLVNSAILYDIDFVDNDLYATGYFSKEVFFGTDTSLSPNNNSNSSSPDVFIVKYGNVNLLNDEDYSNISVSVFPNPAKDKLKITSNQIIDKLTVVDINGRVLNEIKLSNLDYSLDVSILNKGVYFLEIQSRESKSVKKFIKN